MKEKPKKTLCDALIELLESDPDGWIMSPYALIHRETFMEIWVRGMPFDIHLLAPEQRKFNFFEKLDLWLAIRRWNKRASGDLVEKLKEKLAEK